MTHDYTLIKDVMKVLMLLVWAGLGAAIQWFSVAAIVELFKQGRS